MAFWKRGGGGGPANAPPPTIDLSSSRLVVDLLRGLPRRGIPGEGPRVLLAGPPSGQTIETFHGVGCRVTVAGDDQPEGSIGLPDRSLDLVLGYDLLDLLDGRRARMVCEEWARLIRPSGGLYLLARRDAGVYPPPWRVDVLPDGVLRLVPVPGDPPVVHPRANREIEELVRPLSVRDIHLRRDGLREILCRRQ